MDIKNGIKKLLHKEYLLFQKIQSNSQYRSASVLQPFLPIGGLPAPLARNRLREIEEEIKREQEKNTPTLRKNNYGKAD